MRFLSRTRSQPSAAMTATDARDDGLRRWRGVLSAEDPLLSDNGANLLGAIRSFQIAAASGDRDALLLLAGCFLILASVPVAGNVPSDASLRFAGLAATAVGTLGDDPAPPSALLEWFRRVRGRLRGSIFVPRDVESAFSGRHDLLAPLALDPSNYEKLAKLFGMAVGDVRRSASLALVKAEPGYASASPDTQQARARAVEGDVRRLPWRAEDLESLRAVWPLPDGAAR